MMVWHYTTWSTLRDIVNAGVLIPSNAGAPGEVALLWFSAHQQWEPTATKMVALPRGRVRKLTLAEQTERFGRIRFGLPSDDPRLMSWDASCRAAGTPRATRRALEAVGRKQGAKPSDWRACLAAVPLGELRFELWLRGEWYAADDHAGMIKVWENHVQERSGGPPPDL